MKSIAKRLTWSKNGWVKTENLGKFSRRNNVYPNITEMDPIRTGVKEIDMILDAREEIRYGRLQDSMDKLPQSIRQLVQDPYTWYFSPDGKLYKALDAETQARGRPEFNEAPNPGTDRDETTTGIPEAISKMLEAYNLLPAEEYTEDVFSSQDNIAADIDIAKVAISNLGTIIDNNEETDEIDPWDEIDSDETVSRQHGVTNNIILSDEARNKLEDILAKVGEAIERLNDKTKEWEVTQSAKEEITKSCYNELVNRLDSPWCGYGYRAPKIKWDRVWSPPDSSDEIEAAETRVLRFERFYNRIMNCKSMNDLYGPLVFDKNKASRGGGVYGELQKLFDEDKVINDNWSDRDIYNDKGEVVKKSALTTQKEEFVDKQRKLGKDEETIRKMVWHRFDRTRGVDKNGKKWSDSIWKTQQRLARRDLNFTSEQRNSLFEATKKVRAKFAQNDNDELKDKINTAFKQIITLENIKVFKDWLYKRDTGYEERFIISPRTGAEVLVSKRRNFKMGEAIIDKLSINQTLRLEGALGRREKHIKQRNQFFLHLDHITKHKFGIVSNRPEESIECHYCGRWVTGIPEFIPMEGNKGYFYIPCDCSKRIWLMDFNKTGSEPENL